MKVRFRVVLGLVVIGCLFCAKDLLADDWVEVFSDTGTGDWVDQWFLEGDKAAITNGNDGMTFAAGPVLNENASHAVLWTKRSFAGDVKVEYDYTRLDSNMDAGVNILYIQATGLGTKEWPADIAQSSEKRWEPWMKYYFLYMNTLHISYASDGRYVSARRYPSADTETFNVSTQFEPKYTDLDLFQPGELWHITAIKNGDRLQFIAEHGGQLHKFSWDLNQFPEVTEGRIGLRHMWTRSSRYRNIRVFEKNTD